MTQYDVFKKLCVNLAISLAAGLILYLMLFGLYEIIAKKCIILNASFAIVVFAASFISAGVVLEHKNPNPESPYYLVGAFVIASAASFVLICTANGLLTIIREGLPKIENFISYLFALAAVAFAIIRILRRKIPKELY